MSDLYQNKKNRDRTDKTDTNAKRILCFNKINTGICNYGSRCLYAHKLADQKVNPLREKIYNIIRSTTDLSMLDLVNDTELYKNMIQMTKVCKSCARKVCPGGYNCKHGAISQNYRICYTDLVYGRCDNENCSYVHLTNKGLVPYTVQKNHDLTDVMTNDDDSDITPNRVLKELVGGTNGCEKEYTDSDTDTDIGDSDAIRDYLRSSDNEEYDNDSSEESIFIRSGKIDN